MSEAEAEAAVAVLAIVLAASQGDLVLAWLERRCRRSGVRRAPRHRAPVPGPTDPTHVPDPPPWPADALDRLWAAVAAVPGEPPTPTLLTAEGAC